MTPVRILLPSTIVTWPTRTPVTSVIALSGPVGRTPKLIPASRALGRCSAWPVELIASKARRKESVRIRTSY